MASALKRLGKKIVNYPEDTVPVISSSTYFKSHVHDPRKGVSHALTVSYSTRLVTLISSIDIRLPQ